MNSNKRFIAPLLLLVVSILVFIFGIGGLAGIILIAPAFFIIGLVLLIVRSVIPHNK